ncbi:18318_t:CDS:10 [Entrophospora sp. SA101]|nr:18318_t:CDS:10 [Entrophospora sp. SA101]
MSTALQHINGCGINTTNSTYNNHQKQKLPQKSSYLSTSLLATKFGTTGIGTGPTTPPKTTTATASATATVSSAKAQTTVKSPTWREIKQMPGMIFSFPIIFPRSTFATIGDDSIKDDKSVNNHSSASSTSGTSTPSADNNTTTDVIQSTSISTDATATTNAQLTTVTAATSARSRKGRRPSTSKSTTSTSSATTKPSIANPVINLDYNPYYVEGPSATIIHRPLLLPDIVRSYAQEKRNQMRSRPITRAKNKQENHILDIHRERDILSSTRRDRRSPRVVSSNPNSHRSRTNYNNSSNNNNSAIANHNIINGRRSRRGRESSNRGSKTKCVCPNTGCRYIPLKSEYNAMFKKRVAVAGSGASNTPGSSNNDSDDIRRCCKCQTADKKKPLILLLVPGVMLLKQTIRNCWIKARFLPNSDDIIIVDVNIQDLEYYDSANSINALLDANDVNEYFDIFDQDNDNDSSSDEEIPLIPVKNAINGLESFIDNRKIALSEVATSTQMNRKRCNIKSWDRN